jgi:hypothetical protein
MAHFLCPHLSLALLPSLLTTTQHVTHRIPASRVPQHNHPLGSRFRGAAYSSICFCVFEEGVVSDGVGLTHGLGGGEGGGVGRKECAWQIGEVISGVDTTKPVHETVWE